MRNTANTTTGGSVSSYNKCMGIIRSLKEDDPKREEYLGKLVITHVLKGNGKFYFL